MIKTNERIALIRTLIDANDDNHFIARAIFINDARDIAAADFRDDHFPIDTHDFDALLALIAPFFADDAPAELINARSSLCIDDFSLCPMHTIDYAICFDDDEPTCAAIRACFPCHDT